MNVLTSTWRQLVRRRLWPVALALVAALAAVPVLLAREADPVPVPELPSTSAPAENAKADDALAEPVVAKAATEDRSRRRRVLGVRKDPFEPAPVKLPKTTKKKSTTKKSSETTVKDTGGSTSPSSSGGGTVTTPTTPVATPAPPKKKTYAKDSIIVRFGDAESDLQRLNVKKLEPLPDDETPLLIYMGLTDHGKKAVFLVDASLDTTGDGDCKPHPSNCERIELAKGETEFFDVISDETGDITAQYELDLIDIK